VAATARVKLVTSTPVTLRLKVASTFPPSPSSSRLGRETLSPSVGPSQRPRNWRGHADTGGQDQAPPLQIVPDFAHDEAYYSPFPPPLFRGAGQTPDRWIVLERGDRHQANVENQDQALAKSLLLTDRRMTFGHTPVALGGAPDMRTGPERHTCCRSCPVRVVPFRAVRRCRRRRCSGRCGRRPPELGRTAPPGRRKLAAVHEPVNRHLRHAHDRGDLGHGQKPDLRELTLGMHRTPRLHTRSAGFPTGERSALCVATLGAGVTGGKSRDQLVTKSPADTPISQSTTRPGHAAGRPPVGSP
jgi:hypothetical protein